MERKNSCRSGGANMYGKCWNGWMEMEGKTCCCQTPKNRKIWRRGRKRKRKRRWRDKLKKETKRKERRRRRRKREGRGKVAGVSSYPSPLPPWHWYHLFFSIDTRTTSWWPFFFSSLSLLRLRNFIIHFGSHEHSRFFCYYTNGFFNGKAPHRVMAAAATAAAAAAAAFQNWIGGS